jgi:hypothetical protein
MYLLIVETAEKNLNGKTSAQIPGLLGKGSFWIISNSIPAAGTNLDSRPSLVPSAITLSLDDRRIRAAATVRSGFTWPAVPPPANR